MKTEEEKKAVEIMIEAAKDTEYLEDAMLLGYRALKEHKYPKPPELNLSTVTTRTMKIPPSWRETWEIDEIMTRPDRDRVFAYAQARSEAQSASSDTDPRYFYPPF